MGWIRVPFVFGGHKTEMHFPIRAILSLKDPSANIDITVPEKTETTTQTAPGDNIVSLSQHKRD